MKYLITIVLIYTFVFSSNNTNNNYPIPSKTKGRLFFIQRNLNSNTIVYDANFDKYGNLNEEKPVDVYWIRFDEDGQRMELRRIEQLLAFGVEFSKLNPQGSEYRVNIVAEKSRDIILKQIAPFEAQAYLKIDNKMSQISYLYLNAIDGIIPELQSIEYFGIDTLTNKNTYEKVHYN